MSPSLRCNRVARLDIVTYRMKGFFVLFCYISGFVMAGALKNSLQGPDVTDPSKESRNDCTEVLEECTPCIEQEKRWQVEQCGETGLHQKFRCKDGKEEFFSCSRAKLMEERHFWIFESIVFTVGLLSYIIVIMRQRKLDREVLQRIKRQVSSSI